MSKRIQIEQCANGYILTVTDVTGGPAPRPTPEWDPRAREYVFQNLSDMNIFLQEQLEPVPMRVDHDER